MTDNNELKELFDPILAVIMKYENDYDSILAIREIAEEKLGKNWRDVIAEYLVIYDDETKDAAEAKLNQAMDYDGALLAWEEANYLISDESVTKEQVKNRYHDLKEWLQYFGDEGESLIEKLKEKIGDEIDDLETNDDDDDGLDDEDVVEKPVAKKSNFVNDSYEETPRKETGVTYGDKIVKLDDSFAEKYGVSPEVLWDFNAFILLNDYYDQTISRIGARCVRMGGLALNEYPYYGYVLDLLDEIVTIGTNIEGEEKLIPLFEKYFKGGYIEFKKVLKNYRKEFEENAPPEMIADNTNELDRLIKELGAIDTSKVKDTEADLFSIGRAKSDFDPIDDDDKSLPQAPPPPPVSSFKEMNSNKDEED